jgi:hypothetical protein
MVVRQRKPSRIKQHSAAAPLPLVAINRHDRPINRIDRANTGLLSRLDLRQLTGSDTRTLRRNCFN